MLAIAVALSVAPIQALPSSMPASQLEGMAPLQLARLLLPAGAAAQVIDGTISRGRSPSPVFVVHLWQRPEPVGPMLCRRRTHSTYFMTSGPGGYVDSDPDVSAQPVMSSDGFASTYPDRATPERCGRVTAFATGRSDGPEETMAAVNLLTAAMAAAAGRSPLRFELQCRAEDGSCGNPRAAMAALPLDAMFGVDFGSSAYRVPNGGNGSGPQSGGQAAAAAVDPPGTPTIRFGMSGRSGHSWFVTLVSSRGRLAQVRMWRTPVIYH
ncbi:MAG TPA: hypothetical protein VEW04_02650 [Allosphingosinicella sp.]|nr:hypothetical protein [Allosphingosinicella sp.]